jgi:hypothetical protein
MYSRMVQFLKRLLELSPYRNVLIVYCGLIDSQLYSRLYLVRV